MHVYEIRSNHDAPVAETVGEAEVRARIDHLSGRGVSGYIMGRAIRNKNHRAYIATARGSVGRMRFGQGFLVQRVEVDA